MSWILLANAVATFGRIERLAPAGEAPRRDLLAELLQMQMTIAFQSAVFCPDPEESARFFGEYLKAQSDLVVHHAQGTLEAYRANIRRPT